MMQACAHSGMEERHCDDTRPGAARAARTTRRRFMTSGGGWATQKRAWRVVRDEYNARRECLVGQANKYICTYIYIVMYVYIYCYIVCTTPPHLIASRSASRARWRESKLLSHYCACCCKRPSSSSSSSSRVMAKASPHHNHVVSIDLCKHMQPLPHDGLGNPAQRLEEPKDSSGRILQYYTYSSMLILSQALADTLGLAGQWIQVFFFSSI